MLCWHGRVRVVVAKAIGQFVNRDIEPRLAVSGESPMPVPGATERNVSSLLRHFVGRV